MSELCAYCRKRSAVNRDHVIPKSLRRKRKKLAAWTRRKLPYSSYASAEDIPVDLLQTVPSCFECNTRKGTRMLVPPSWADRIPALKRYVPGEWRVWNGDPRSPAFRRSMYDSGKPLRHRRGPAPP